MSRFVTIQALLQLKSPAANEPLRDVLAGKIRAEKVAEGEEIEPRGQVKFSPGDKEISLKYADETNCAIVLSKVGDAESLPIIRKLQSRAAEVDKKPLAMAVKRLEN